MSMHKRKRKLYRHMTVNKLFGKGFFAGMRDGDSFTIEGVVKRLGAK